MFGLFKRKKKHVHEYNIFDSWVYKGTFGRGKGTEDIADIRLRCSCGAYCDFAKYARRMEVNVLVDGEMIKRYRRIDPIFHNHVFIEHPHELLGN